MVRTTIYIPEEVHRDLKILAAKTGQSISEIILNSLDVVSPVSQKDLDKVAGTISSLGKVDKTATGKQIKPHTVIEVNDPKTFKPNGNYCKHGSQKGLCKFGCR